MSDHDVTEKQLPPRAGSAGVVTAVPAASVIILRRPFDVLLMQRNSASTFAPGAWLFPGGAVETQDRLVAHGDEGAARVAAVREVFEETGIWLGQPLEDPATRRAELIAGTTTIGSLAERAPMNTAELVWTSRWITPEGAPKRFDTWFFLVEVAGTIVADPDMTELVAHRWLPPAEALAMEKSGALPMLFPTIRHLEDLARFTDVDRLLESRRGAIIPTTRPVLTIVDGKRTIRIPDEP